MEHIEIGLDKHNVLAMLSRKEANHMLEANVGTKYSDLVTVRGWNPAPYDVKEGMSIWLTGDELNHDEIYYSPVIRDVNVDWMFSAYYLADALKVFDIFEREPRIISAKKASPLWIEPDVPVEKQKDTDIVILIAPRIPNEKEELK